MRRTFNYTGRRRIRRERISIRVYKLDSGSRWFDADLRLAQLRLPADARVFVEAYFERAYLRFDFGRVDAISPPEDRSLGEIDYGGRINFRIKVTDSTGAHGKLLATADSIIPSRPQEEEQARESLLPVEQRDDMGQELWRVAFDLGGPYLEVNSTIEDVMGLFRNNRTVAALVYPQALRIILIKALLMDGASTAEGGWESRWLRFGTLLTAAPPPMHPDEVDEAARWIDSVTAAFARKLRAVDVIRHALKEEKL